MTTVDTTAGQPVLASAQADPASPASVFKWLLTKELWDHLHGKRVWFGALLCAILCVLAAGLRISDYRQSHFERNAFLQRWRVSVEEQVLRDETIQVENTRPVSPLTVLSMGLEPVTPFRFTSTKEGLRFGETRGARSSVDALFGYLDIAFIVSTLLSLLAIVLTFDSVCGERAYGTLPLLLSYPVKRSSVLFAKLLASTIVLAICFLPALTLAFIAVLISGVPVMSLTHWLIYALMSMLYAFVFATVGVAVSARAKRPADAALISIFAWALLVFVVPRAVALVVNGVHGQRRSVELAVSEDAVSSQLKLEYTRKEQKAFETYFAEGGGARGAEEFARQRKEALADLRSRRLAALRRLWDQQDRERQSRERMTRALAALSPTAMFNGAAAELAWTGFRQREIFLSEARTYDEKIGRRLAESREIYVARDNSGPTSAVVAHDDIKPYLIPFAGTWASPRSVLASVVLPLAGLIAFAAVFFLYGYISFLTMDVRV